MAKLIFVPWHDCQDFLSNGILTRDQYVLYAMAKIGINPAVACGKPRTVLNKPKTLPETVFAKGSVCGALREIYQNTARVESYRFIDIRQATLRRTWWSEVYQAYAGRDEFQGDLSDAVAYSNNPFAFPLLLALQNRGAKILFDAMDNFAIHPSLNMTEHNTAYRGYGEMAVHADFLSANSDETCEYFKQNFAKQPLLLKNGVLEDEYGTEALKNAPKTPLENQLNEDKQSYKGVAAYLGKMSLRMDMELVEAVATQCPDWLFAFVGPQLKGQSDELNAAVARHGNIKYYPAISSTQVPSFLRAADVFTIPNTVGRNEIGGNPLKMYQYMMTQKPILSTPTPGVEEFPDIITSKATAGQWAETLHSWGEIMPKAYEIPQSILWERRLSPMLDFASKLM